MGFLKKMFGAGLNKDDLIRSLAKNRISEDPLASSMSYDESMVDSLGAMELAGIPEAAIVTIVETYALSKKSGASDSDIFDHIEAHRSQIGSGVMPNPLNLESYIQYRIAIEHSHGAPISKQFVSEAVAICCKQYDC